MADVPPRETSFSGDELGETSAVRRLDRSKWPDQSKLTTFKAGLEYSGRTKPKLSVPFHVPTEISGILGIEWKVPENLQPTDQFLATNTVF